MRRITFRIDAEREYAESRVPMPRRRAGLVRAFFNVKVLNIK
jgi:hypothetical protein